MVFLPNEINHPPPSLIVAKRVSPTFSPITSHRPTTSGRATTTIFLLLLISIFYVKQIFKLPFFSLEFRRLKGVFKPPQRWILKTNLRVVFLAISSMKPTSLLSTTSLVFPHERVAEPPCLCRDYEFLATSLLWVVCNLCGEAKKICVAVGVRRVGKKEI